MDTGRRGFNQICGPPIPIALPHTLWHPPDPEYVNPKSRLPLKPLETGQVWRIEDSRLHIERVGKHLVHYKLFKGQAKRTPLSLSNKESVERYLKDNKAVLVQG